MYISCRASASVSPPGYLFSPRPVKSTPNSSKLGTSYSLEYEVLHCGGNVCGAEIAASGDPILVKTDRNF